jgi:dynein heavy chain, axonemal
MRQIEKLDKNKSAAQDPVYEQLGFKHNLKFSARNELRDACKKFLRFAFLLDFVALESLSSIFLSSVRDTLAKIGAQADAAVDYELDSGKDGLAGALPLGEAAQASSQQPRPLKVGHALVELADGPAHLQEHPTPLFYADCLYRAVEIPPQNLYTDLVEPFQLPPLGKSTVQDFNPMVHLEIEPDPDGASSEGSESAGSVRQPREEETTDSADGKLRATKVRGIHNLWLSVYPDQEDLVALLNETFQLGFDSLKNFEKWAMHADLKPYDRVLEPWDYRSYARWEPPTEDNQLYLNCDDWLQESPDYQHLEENVEALVTRAMQKIKRQYAKLEPVLHEYWTNQQLGDFSILTHDRLRSPTEVLPVLLQRLVDQKEAFKVFVPSHKDLGLLRVRFQDLKNALSPQPKLCLARLKEILPRMVRSRIEKVKEWMEEHIRLLRTFPTNVDEYVNQIQSLEYVEDNYQAIKDQVELNDQIFAILDAYDLPAREDKSSRFIDEIYQLINSLNSAIYDTKDKADRRKEQIKKEIAKKVPKLHQRIEAIAQEMGQSRFVMIEGANVAAVLAELGAMETRMQAILAKKKAIQRYQKTLDMGFAEPFNNAEDARVLLGYLTRLWQSLHAWQQNSSRWKVAPFDEIDIEAILEQSTHHSKTVLMCERNLPKESTAVQVLKKMVFDFKEAMPIVEALGNKHLKEVHWLEMKEILGIRSFPLEEKQFSLGELVDLNVAQFADEIVNVSVTATQEFNLQTQLDQLTHTWQKLNFEVARHQDKDAFKLVGLEHIQTVLDESMQSVSLIVGSRYVKRLQSQA